MLSGGIEKNISDMKWVNWDISKRHTEHSQ